MNNENDDSALPVLLVSLLKGILYQENDPKRWNQLLIRHNQVRDYVEVLGLELVLDEAEGYAFLTTLNSDDEEDSANIPRLISRRPLSFPVYY